jgi:hypothetical protein
MSAKEISGVKITNSALEEAPNGAMILRGTISAECLKNLKVDEYQREVLAPTGGGGRATSRIRKGIEEGTRLPDIELGMRGDNFSAHGKTVTLHDPVYIIDGLQRVSALMAHIEEHGTPNGAQPLGATIYLNTTKQAEKDRFAILNGAGRIPVSPGVLLRNARDKHPSILTLYGLSRNDPSFALYGRVSWDQRMKQGEILKALLFVKSALALHSVIHKDIVAEHGIAKRGTGGREHKGAVTLDRIAKQVGLQNLRDNMKDFFALIDDCYGIKSIEYGEAQGHLRGNFLITLGNFIANNSQLWDGAGKRIKIDSKTRERFKLFPVNDPEIRRLCAAGASMVLPMLYKYLLDHMNKHRSKNRFR